MTAPPFDVRTDLNVAITYCSVMGVSATRAYDVMLQNAQALRWAVRTQKPIPAAELFMDDFLADFDRLAVVAERLRALRTAQVGQAVAA